MQILQTKRQVEDGLSVVGVGIALLPYLHGFPQVRLCLVEPSAAQVPESRLAQAAHVVGVAPQGFFVVVEGAPRSVAVLLQVQARQVKLVVGLRIFGRQRSLSSIGNGTDLVGLRLP